MVAAQPDSRTNREQFVGLHRPRRCRIIGRLARGLDVTVRTGGCLCGAIRYESGGEPSFSLKCHCRDCQRQRGAAYVAAVRMPSAEFRITRGTPKTYVAKSDAGNDISRVFCGDCGAPLYVQVSTRPDMVGIRVSSFDDPSWFKPEADIFVKSAQPWDYMNPALPKFPTYPVGKAY